MLTEICEGTAVSIRMDGSYCYLLKRRHICTEIQNGRSEKIIFVFTVVSTARNLPQSDHICATCRFALRCVFTHLANWTTSPDTAEFFYSVCVLRWLRVHWFESLDSELVCNWRNNSDSLFSFIFATSTGCCYTTSRTGCKSIVQDSGQVATRFINQQQNKFACALRGLGNLDVIPNCIIFYFLIFSSPKREAAALKAKCSRTYEHTGDTELNNYGVLCHLMTLLCAYPVLTCMKDSSMEHSPFFLRSC